jgi:hypothetical protein
VISSLIISVFVSSSWKPKKRGLQPSQTMEISSAHRISCRRRDFASYDLQPAVVVITGVGEQGELQYRTPDADDRRDESLVDAFEGVDKEMDVEDKMQRQRTHEIHLAHPNKLGCLLLPFGIEEALMNDIDTHKHLRTIVLYDTAGRVHQLVFIPSLLFMVLTPLWHPPVLECARLVVWQLQREPTPLLNVDGLPNGRTQLLLPPNSPEAFLRWQPELEANQEFMVEYDSLTGRLYSLEQFPAAPIHFASLWEWRF